MAKYFKNISSLDDLKKQFRQIAKIHHPENGGDPETMKDICVEFDALYAIWKSKTQKEDTPKDEEDQKNGQEYRRHFYNANGWAGRNYDPDLSFDDIVKLVRAYVKEKYPTCKFSIRKHSSTMTNRLIIDMLEFPAAMYKTAEEIRADGHTVTRTIKDGPRKGKKVECITDEIQSLLRRWQNNQVEDYGTGAHSFDDIVNTYKKLYDEGRSFLLTETDYFASVKEDIKDFVNSYNYDDSDIYTDYFDRGFYFFGVDSSRCKQVEKTARIKNKSATPRKAKVSKADRETVQKALKAFHEGGYNKAYETIYEITQSNAGLNTSYILEAFKSNL